MTPSTPDTPEPLVEAIRAELALLGESLPEGSFTASDLVAPCARNGLRVSELIARAEASLGA
ncbi:hypothetical protein [Intrasporangium mesophilum]